MRNNNDPSMPYALWTTLLLAKHRAFGKLAQDIYDDPNFPRMSRSKRTIRKYLQDHGAADSFLQAFDESWEWYLGERDDEYSSG